MDTLLRSLAGSLAGSGPSDSIETVMSNAISSLSNDPSVIDTIDQHFSSGDRSQSEGQPNAPSIGRLLNEFGPFLSSMLNPTTSTMTTQAPAPRSQMDLSELSVDRATVWRTAFEEDTRRMSHRSTHPDDLSFAYLAGRVTRGSSRNILPRDEAFD